MESEQISLPSPMGMPVYEDTQVRSIVDALDENRETPDWYPANEMTRKLWHCLEALRDIDLALENVSNQQDVIKRRRLLKQFSVPLHTLAMTVVHLCNQIAGDADAKRWLEKGTLSQVSKIKTEFGGLIPIDHKGDLSVIRNRLGGHIDRNLSPRLVREILSRNAMSSFGRWLHICIHALLDLMKLNIYAWSVNSSTESHLRLMTNEPFLLTFLCGDATNDLIAVHLSKRSPRMVIIDVVERAIHGSQWMFESGQPRIGSLRVDTGDEWNTFKGSTAIWNQPPTGY
jgi:hypothetical protein